MAIIRFLDEVANIETLHYELSKIDFIRVYGEWRNYYLPENDDPNLFRFYYNPASPPETWIDGGNIYEGYWTDEGPAVVAWNLEEGDLIGPDWTLTLTRVQIGNEFEVLASAEEIAHEINAGLSAVIFYGLGTGNIWHGNEAGNLIYSHPFTIDEGHWLGFWLAENTDRGNDIFYGGAGNDILIGGYGENFLDGGGGFDFVYAGHQRQDFLDWHGAHFYAARITNDGVFFEGEEYNYYNFVPFLSGRSGVLANLDLVSHNIESIFYDIEIALRDAYNLNFISANEIFPNLFDFPLLEAGEMITSWQLADEGPDRVVNIEGIRGSQYDDVIIAAGRTEFVHPDFDWRPGGGVAFGEGGDDVMIAVAGTAFMSGGYGDDLMVVYWPDFESGESGEFGVVGVHLNGDEGNDTLIGGPGNDTLVGGWINEQGIGGGGRNIIFGIAGNNHLHGSSASDLIYGGPGNDKIYAYGIESNYLSGGGGVDEFWINYEESNLSRIDIIDDFDSEDKIFFETDVAFRNFASDPIGNIGGGTPITVGVGDGSELLGTSQSAGIQIEHFDTHSIIHIGLDEIPGADARIRLDGDFRDVSFMAHRSSIYIEKVYRPTTQDLEYAARVIAYQRFAEAEKLLPGDYEVSQIISTPSGFWAIGLASDSAEPILAIRGTAELADVIADLDRTGIGASQVADAWHQISTWLSENPGAHVTGHSLGGAQAQLVATEAARVAELPLASVTTFNSPGIPADRIGGGGVDTAVEVRHFVASGDVVSKAGLAFLPGELKMYNFRTMDPAIPFSQIVNAHTAHWSQGDIDPGMYPEYDGIDISPVAQTLTTDDLGKLNFSYLWSGGNFDIEYFGLLKAISKVPYVGPPVAMASMTRAGVETERDFFGIVARLLRGELTLDEAALEAVSSAIKTARGWTIEVANTLQGWGEQTWAGISRWGAETWEQVADFGLEIWERTTEWGQQTFDNIVTHGAQVALAALEKIIDIQISAAKAATFVPRTLWNFFTSEPDAEIIFADAEGNATHLQSASPGVLIGGDGDGTLSSSAGSSLFVTGSGATRHEMTGGGNVVWGLPSDLNGDTTLGFGATDRFNYIETAFTSDMLLRDPGSAILIIDTNGDSETDVTIRLEGDYDLDAFIAVPDASGTAVFYGDIPADEVVLVSGTVTDQSGNTLSGASVRFERDFGELPMGVTADNGSFGFDVLRDVTGRVDANREFSMGDPVITALDALQVLRLAVGIEPDWGSAKAYNFIAADVDRDGQVSALDALEVLRHAVGLKTEHAPEWVFIDEKADFSAIDRNNVVYDTGVNFAAINPELELSMRGILLGSMQEYA